MLRHLFLRLGRRKSPPLASLFDREIARLATALQPGVVGETADAAQGAMLQVLDETNPHRCLDAIDRCIDLLPDEEERLATRLLVYRDVTRVLSIYFRFAYSKTEVLVQQGVIGRDELPAKPLADAQCL
jgi:hypothetical protein